MAVTALIFVFVLLVAAPLLAQSSATLRGHVVDRSGGTVTGAAITLRSLSMKFDASVRTDSEGRYLIAEIPAGTYALEAAAAGFRSEVVELLVLDVGRSVVRDFRLDIGEQREAVIVTAEIPLIDRATTVVGHVVTAQTVLEAPLNGRHFTDLGLLVPGSVAPSQTGFSTTPSRGVDALAINTAGNREEAVAFVVNGVTTNNVTFGSLMFQPPLASVHEFRIDNSAFSVEYGQVSGAIVNIVTRSGTDVVRGDAFEFLRNEALDARNFFEFISKEPHRFERNQFGGSVGGPLRRGRSFFFATYEGLRQRQGLDMNSLVLSDEQRATATDPTALRLIELLPRSNFVDAGGTPRFVGSASALVDVNRWTVDLRHTLGSSDRLHLFYGRQRNRVVEPAAQGTSIPGFGTVSQPLRTVLTLSETHTFGATLLNEVRLGRSGLDGTVAPAASLNPMSFGIRTGVERPIGLPQMVVAGGLNFGGPASFPQTRRDASYVLADTFSYVSGRHFVRLGGEYRHFLNFNFAEGTGLFNFPTVAEFLAGTANAFSITLGDRQNHIVQRAAGFFVQDSVTIDPRLTLELGLRYEAHVIPTEQDHRFVVFDAATASLLRVGVDVDEIYRHASRNLEPRAGLAWDVVGDGRTILRAAYRRGVDEPSTTAVRDTAANPPSATPLSAIGSVRLAEAITMTRGAGLAPMTVDPKFRSPSVQSWNVNVQRLLGSRLAGLVGYFGSRGRDLRISRNLNQPVNDIRPFAALSSTSPILPGTALGNITQVESTGFSTYHALWASVTQRLSRGFQLDTSYTWSKSLDTNSLNSSGFAVQDSYDIANQYGLSDFDARHRLVVSAIYELPFTRHPLSRGWQVAAIVQSQSGNPVNIVTSNSSLNGVPNTVRPDVTGPIRIIGSVDQWFDTSAFAAVDRFGNLGRNVVIGPGFHNTDLSIIKNIRRDKRVGLQLRMDVFDIFNHANFGPPGNVVGGPTFGKITRTRFPTGEAGSSRQIQLAVKAWF
ncbi:MAG: TonB-dependent receptor [Vicinamibacterales bacterium]